MSFMKTLATVAAGFAAAKGIEKYQQMGGMAGLQKMMGEGGGIPGMGGAGGAMPGMPDLGKMAEQMGLGNMMGGLGGGSGAGAGANPLEQIMGMLGGGGQGTGAAGAAGLGGLMASMKGAAAASGGAADDMMGALFGGTPASQAKEDNAKLMLRAMIQAAKADGEIDPHEKAQILEALGDVSPEERAFVQQELEAPLDAHGLAQDTSDAMKAQVYATSLMAIQVDNRAEAAYLQQLASAMGISPEMRARMHEAMGVPLV